MKEIMAIIRIDKINKTKNALINAGISSMHVKDVLGRGKGLVDILRLNGAEKLWEEKMEELGAVGRLIPKRKISIIVPDKLVQKVVQTIITTNQTGKSGDGKIFVLPVSNSIRIRDGQEGNETLDEG
ncbi:MAG: P-II family nitrogen regulator [Planctomycetaceae bacterium]|jgi:nitrogen regulatory protein PII 2|nr:P-II family nitrogen regulator [Planctomycetaceae bacterium]